MTKNMIHYYICNDTDAIEIIPRFKHVSIRLVRHFDIDLYTSSVQTIHGPLSITRFDGDRSFDVQDLQQRLFVLKNKFDVRNFSNYVTKRYAITFNDMIK